VDYLSALAQQQSDQRLSAAERKTAEDDFAATGRQKLALEHELSELGGKISLEETRQSELRHLIAENEERNR
jgi:hypothetical protein